MRSSLIPSECKPKLVLGKMSYARALCQGRSQECGVEKKRRHWMFALRGTRYRVKNTPSPRNNFLATSLPHPFFVWKFKICFLLSCRMKLEMTWNLNATLLQRHLRQGTGRFYLYVRYLKLESCMHQVRIFFGEGGGDLFVLIFFFRIMI